MASRDNVSRRPRRQSSPEIDQDRHRHQSRRKQDHDSDSSEDRQRRKRRSMHDDDDGRDKPRSRRDRSGERHRRHRPQSRDRDHARKYRASRSPPGKRRRRSESPGRSPVRKSRGALPSQDASFQDSTHSEGGPPPVEKQKPNFKPTGLLAKEANTITGTTTVLKYHEPPEARKPPGKQAWRMYVFSLENELLDTIHLHRRSCWLIGRDQTITDLYIDDKTVSKQHAVIQFRYRPSTNEYGDQIGKVKPYLIDLESARGTVLNGKPIGESRYVELIDGDVVRFGDLKKDYVMMLPPAEG
ncbi:SMAD/FHA domain-containing protein [Polychaeton citri CBS 116435]|uniref:SMAD/FHA domain-containing protein n=1 Tax=Polychaeton citri CBS 116435 TaxID=1314669 RepID=A0A9P4PYF8_9PEZI|nr:SMAD/FHA domain-containing protein [Polychaeton citri CBS 116435]